jgi:DNA-binding transcriptional ArsR family regulator
MSVLVSSAVWKFQFKDPSMKLVALALADMANDSGESWPSIGSIQERSGLSESSVRRHIRAMEEMGVIERSERFAHERQTSNGYRFTGDFLSKEGGCHPRHPGVSPMEGEGVTHDRGEGSAHNTPLKRNKETSMKLPHIPAPLGGDFFTDSPPLPAPPDSKTVPQHKPLPSELIRMGALLGRRPNSKWSPKEIKAAKSLLPVPEEDFALLERYYRASIPEAKDYRRRTLQVLLNNWQGEVDRARKYKPASCF